MNTFRTLELAIAFNQKARGLKLKQPYRDQFERALLSIPLNLSEGSAKPSARERKRYYTTALGSVREVQTSLRIIGEDTS